MAPLLRMKPMTPTPRCERHSRRSTVVGCRAREALSTRKHGSDEQRDTTLRRDALCEHVRPRLFFR